MLTRAVSNFHIPLWRLNSFTSLTLSSSTPPLALYLPPSQRCRLTRFASGRIRTFWPDPKYSQPVPDPTLTRYAVPYLFLQNVYFLKFVEKSLIIFLELVPYVHMNKLAVTISYWVESGACLSYQWPPPLSSSFPLFSFSLFLSLSSPLFLPRPFLFWFALLSYLHTSVACSNRLDPNGVVIGLCGNLLTSVWPAIWPRPWATWWWTGSSCPRPSPSPGHSKLLPQCNIPENTTPPFPPPREGKISNKERLNKSYREKELKINAANN